MAAARGIAHALRKVPSLEQHVAMSFIFFPTLCMGRGCCRAVWCGKCGFHCDCDGQEREGVEEKVGRDCSCKEHGGFATDIYTCLCSMRLLLCHSLRER